MNIWRRPFVAFVGGFCATMGINALSNATALLAGHYQASLAEISPATSLYLIAEIAALPLMPVIVARYGVARVLERALWGFLFASLLCLFAPTLSFLFVSRTLQGFFGGLLATMPLLIMKSDLPPDKQPLAMASAGFVAGFAPIVGPLLTASLDADSVQLIFLAMASLIILGLFVLPASPPRPSTDADFPWLSAVAVALFSLGLASTVWAVEHVQVWGGMASSGFRLHLIVGIGIMLLAGLHQWQRSDALLPLRLLSQPRYTGVLFSSMMMGIIVFGFLYLIPYYLIRVHGAGVETLFHVTLYASVPQLLWLPVILFLRSKLSPYALVTLGALAATLSVWQLTDLGVDFGGQAWAVPQGLRAISIPMIVLPLGLLLIRLPPPDDAPALTSLYGLCRTIGGIIGVTGLTAYTEAKYSHYKQIITASPQSVTASSAHIEQVSWLYAFNDTFHLITVAMFPMLGYFAWLALQQMIKRWNNLASDEK